MKKIFNILGSFTLASVAVTSATGFTTSAQTKPVTEFTSNVTNSITRKNAGDKNYYLALDIYLTYGGGGEGYGFQNFNNYYGKYTYKFGEYFLQYLDDNDFASTYMSSTSETHWPVAYNTRLETHMDKFGSAMQYVGQVAEHLTQNGSDDSPEPIWFSFHSKLINAINITPKDPAGIHFYFYFTYNGDGNYTENLRFWLLF